MNKNRIKENLITISLAIILYLALINFSVLKDVNNIILTIMTPVIYGFVIAFILKGPYNFLREKIFRFNPEEKPLIKSLKAVTALLISYVGFFSAITILLILVIPQLWDSIEKLVSEVPRQLEIFIEFMEKETLALENEEVIQSLDIQTPEVWEELEKMWMDMVNIMTKVLGDVLPAVLNWIVGITSSLTNMLFGFIFSIYFLSGKEKICTQMKKILYAFLPTPVAERILYIGDITNYAFTKFLNGQITEAFILGVLCFFGMTLLEMPYTLLVSVIIGATNIIPIFGPIFGTIPATFIILMDNPTQPGQAVWFVVLMLILQRIDGDIIYPRIVGDSIGLPGVWVMLSIIVGSGLFGLSGMIIGVPISAVIYRLLREATYKKLEEKKIVLE